MIFLSHPRARLPRRRSDGAAGFDLYACENTLVPCKDNLDILLVATLAIIGVWHKIALCLLIVLVLKAMKSRKGPYAVVSTGISIAELPKTCYARVAPCSGIAAKHGIDVGAGVIDSDYRGEIKVLLFNHGISAFKVKAGDRIAQLVFESIEPLAIEPLAMCLTSTERGSDGIGSTGV